MSTILFLKKPITVTKETREDRDIMVIKETKEDRDITVIKETKENRDTKCIITDIRDTITAARGIRVTRAKAIDHD